MKQKFFLFVFILIPSILVFGKPEKEKIIFREDVGQFLFQLQAETVVRGVVTDRSGEPLAGANVIEDGSKNATVTDKNGRFLIRIHPSADLRISFIGYITQIITVYGRSEIRVVLNEETFELNDVMVTALGITKKGTSLPYSTARVAQEDLLRVKDPNMIVALMGKISGMEIHRSASGMGGSVKVSLRGTRSVAGNNQPLYVLDGVPILNTSPEQPSTAIGGVADAGNRDGGDGISNLNPEDVENISILKGASAAALYGTQAANGVILITTKSGSKEKQEITFSSSLMFEQAISLPEFQHTYGVSDDVESWGEQRELKDNDYAGDFFQRGVSAINAVTLSTGNERFQNYFSYANTTARGIVPGHKLSKHNLNLKETAQFFEGRLALEGNVNLMQQEMKNRPTPGGFYMNPLVGLYRFPRGMDMDDFRIRFETFDEQRYLMVQRWHSPTEDFEQNPYWIINRIKSAERQSRVITSLKLNWQVADGIKIQARGNVDYYFNTFRQKFYASTAPALAGLNGRYIDATYRQTLLSGDVMGYFNKTLDVLKINMVIGASISESVTDKLKYDSKTASLKYANIFTVTNINMGSAAYAEEQQQATRQIQSLFATFQLDYKGFLIFDLSARNDWSSTLAFTSHEKKGFFYPSLGFSWLMDKVFKLPEKVNLARLRMAWSQVGNDIPLYITHPLAHVLAGGEIQASDAAPFKEMRPESNSSLEIGTEWVFFKNRLNFDLTWYYSNTRNQFFMIPAKTGDDYAYRYVNAGNVRNRGVEVTLEGVPVVHPLKWKSIWQFSFNRNKVISLHEELPVFIYGPRGFSSSYAMKLTEGGSIGDIYGKAFERDGNGQIVYETEGEKKGLPRVIGEGNTEKVGNANPRFKLSWSNAFSYKGISLYVLLDSRFGGHVLSQTQADMDLYGVTKITADARKRGYVELEGKQISTVKSFFKSVVGGRAGVTEYYIYDATNIRLRELSLGYSLPERWLGTSGFFKEVQVSLIARNLCFIYKKAPFDPDLILSTGNDNQAIDSYGMPTTRNLGITLRFIL